MTLAKKLRNSVINGLAALVIGYSGLNCDNGTSNSVQCNTNSDCATGYQCITNKCELIPENKVPIANASNDQPSNFDKTCFDNVQYNTSGLCPSGYSIKNNIHPNQTITLDGSLSSDPEDKALQYLWRQLTGPSTTLSSNSVVNPYFTPSQIGDYSFGLEVSDGVKESTEDTVNVGIRENLAPVADDVCPIGPVNIPLPFDASGSYDKDGNGGILNGIMSCSWDFGDGQTYTETPTNALDGTFDCKTNHIYSTTGLKTAVLTVTDNDGSTGQKSCWVDVTI